MKTDELFYELFKLDPKSLFRLVRLELEGIYSFESISAKTTEKRFDGFCKRIDGEGPLIFLEIQGYRDPTIYWRLFREVCTYYEQSHVQEQFIAIALFLDEGFDPDCKHLTCVAPNRLIRANIKDCLTAVWGNAGILTVLKPLVVSEKHEFIEQIPQWKTDIHALPLPRHQIETIIALLEYLILQRFPDMTLQEVQNMLQLTPIEKTVAGQELIMMGKTVGLKEGIKEGIKEGQKDGLEKGELIGEIRLAQRLLKRMVSDQEELAWKSLDELRTIFQQLEPELERS